MSYRAYMNSKSEIRNPKSEINSKFQAPSTKYQIIFKHQIPMTETTRNKYDLEERTYQFAKKVALFCKKLSRTISNIEYVRQVIRSSGSVGANYIEANESFSKKDFRMRIKICRKEAKESVHWLRLIIETDEEKFKKEGEELLKEAIELKKIFSSIIEKSK